MINTNPQVIYAKINANIEKIIGKIARQMLDLYPNINDSASSDTLHSFDFRAAIHNMCILIYYTNKKISKYDA